GTGWGAAARRVVGAKEAQPDAPPMVTVIVAEDTDRYARAFTALREASDGTLWCGTLKGLYRLEAGGGRLALLPVDVGMPGEHGEQRYVNDMVEDRFGSLWVA